MEFTHNPRWYFNFVADLTRNQMTTVTTKTCPQCRTEIDKQASICPNCRSRQSSELHSRPVVVWSVLAVLGIPMLIGAAFDPSNATHPGEVPASPSPVVEQPQRAEPTSMISVERRYP